MKVSAETKYWIEARYGGDPPTRRAHHVSFIHDGKMYVHGGEDLFEGILGSMYALSFEFMKSHEVPPCWELITPGNSKLAPGPLSHHSVCIYNNAAYLLGGLKPNGSSSNDLYKYDIAGNKWEVAR
jgi:hypothetical protein